uniref:Uncharacterized protein n=1 Tax=Eutreptiella gymnastica TaxID=73025 RepID=A0A7S4LI45_9EUGL
MEARHEIATEQLLKEALKWFATVQAPVTASGQATAALAIQSFWRGYCVRRGYQRLWLEDIFSTEVARITSARPDEETHRTDGAILIQKLWRGYVARNSYERYLLEAMMQFEADCLRQQRILFQEEVFERNRASEMEVDETTAIYHMHMYSRLSAELQDMERKIRQLLSCNCEHHLHELQEDCVRGVSQVQYRTAAATAIQAQWRGYVHRRGFAEILLQNLRNWERKCAEDDQEVVMAERSDFLDHAKRSQEEVLSTAQKEWAALVEDMLKTKYTVLQDNKVCAATSIQSAWRGYETRQLLTALRECEACERQLRQKTVTQEGDHRGSMQRGAVQTLYQLGVQSIQQEREGAHEVLQQAASEMSKALLVMRFGQERRHLDSLAEGTTQWMALAAAAERYKIRWQHYKCVTQFLLMCMALHFRCLQDDAQARSALAFAEESVRTVLTVEEAAGREHLVKKSDWERRMMSGRQNRQHLESVELRARQGIHVQQDTARYQLADSHQEAVGVVHMRYCMAQLLQRWWRQCLQEEQQRMALRLAQEQQRLALQRQAWAVLIQAMWRGHFCRKNFAKILERLEEERILHKLQEVEARQIWRKEVHCFEAILESWQQLFAGSSRLRIRLVQAQVKTAAAHKIIRWWRRAQKKERAHRAQETLPERQERGGREVLVYEWSWRQQILMQDFTDGFNSLRLKTKTASAATRVQCLWKGYLTRKALPKYIAYREEVTGVLRLWKVERQFIIREQNDEWSDLQQALKQRRFEPVAPPQQRLSKTEQAEKAEMEAIARRNRIREEARKRKAELQEELAILETEERLDRKSIARDFEYGLSDIQNAFFSTHRHTLGVPPLLQPSTPSTGSMNASFSMTATMNASFSSTATSLGPVRAPGAHRRPPSPPLARPITPPPARALDELPALKRVPPSQQRSTRAPRAPPNESALPAALPRPPPPALSESTLMRVPPSPAPPSGALQPRGRKAPSSPRQVLTGSKGGKQVPAAGPSGPSADMRPSVGVSWNTF